MIPEEHFSEKDSLNIISSMISKARNQFSENGHLYLVWGWAILICSLGQFVLQQVVHYSSFYRIWLLIWPVVIYQFIYLRRKGRDASVRTYTDEIMGYVWLVFIVCSLLLIVLLTKRLTTPDYITTIWLVMYGMPTILSGTILRYRLLVVGGIICWLLAIAGSFVPIQYHMLLLSAAVVCGWIVPGYGIQQKYKKQNRIADL
jgi:hypothetical protein